MTTTPLEGDFEDVIYYIIHQEENEYNNNDEETSSKEDGDISVNKIYNDIFLNYIIN